MRLIDADDRRLRAELWTYTRDTCIDEAPFENAIKAIDEAPTIDAVEVVRCKDCKHYEFADNRAFGMPVKYCDWFGFEDVDDNDFCSRGERREESE